MVDGFLSENDLANFSQILAAGKLRGEKKYGTRYQEIQVGVADLPYIWNVIRRIQRYADENIRSMSELPGPWAYRGRYYPDLFTLRRYGAMDPMKVHMDTGSYARCLSAALHVGEIAGAQDSQIGGTLQTYKCRNNCRLWHGWATKRGELQPTEDLRDTEDLVLHEEVHYRPGRLVLFLSETPHGVTRVPQGGQRDVLFVWHSCEPTLVNGAASTGHIELVRALVQARASIHAGDLDESRPLAHAARAGHLSILRYILDQRGSLDDKDAQGWQPLHGASAWGHASVVRHLLSLRASTAARAQNGDSPADLAVLGNRTAVIQDFLSSRAVAVRGSPESTKLLQYAIRAGHDGIMEMLLGRGAAVDVADGQGMRPLFWAAWAGHEPMVRRLLEARADLSATSSHRGRSAEAVEAAAEGGHMAIATLLVQRGVSPKATLRAVKVAVESGHHSVAAVLRPHGAEL